MHSTTLLRPLFTNFLFRYVFSHDSGGIGARSVRQPPLLDVCPTCSRNMGTKLGVISMYDTGFTHSTIALQGPRSRPEKLSSAPRSTSSSYTVVEQQIFAGFRQNKIIGSVDGLILETLATFSISSGIHLENTSNFMYFISSILSLRWIPGGFSFF